MNANKAGVIRDVILTIFDIVINLINVFKKSKPDDKPTEDVSGEHEPTANV